MSWQSVCTRLTLFYFISYTGYSDEDLLNEYIFERKEEEEKNVLFVLMAHERLDIILSFLFCVKFMKRNQIDRRETLNFSH